MPRPLPVTLVAGFLGAGKTSLLHHLVTEHTGGHLALLVEKTGELGVDACALRGLGGAMGRSNDRVDEFSTAGQFQALLREIAQDGRQERVLVEVDGLTQASYWARLLREDQVGGATVEQIVVVVDLLDFHRGAVASDSNPAARALRDFSCAPIAGATLLVLNKCDLLNSTASQEDFPPETPVFESVVYRAFRPFHPQRFWDWFEASHPGLLRVKGLVWLATRNLLVGGVSRTAWQNGCGAAGVWWAALPREEWPSEPEALMEMQQNWREPYGDRRQELVLVGARGPTADAARKLNLCLLSDAEFALPDWRGLPDPFPVWDLDAEG
jgi:G3E family GTPase